MSIIDLPNKTEQLDVPETTKSNVETPIETAAPTALPEKASEDREMTREVNEENIVTINDKRIEIKPTKLKYFRNRTASIFSVLKIVPLNEFLAYDKGVFDKDRDSDQILYDFLVAVFDDERLVRNIYNEMTSEDIEKVLEIFGRINHINDKEEAARKNRAAQVKR